MLRDKVFGLLQKPRFVILLALTVAGAILRIYSLGAQSVWFDESISGIAARGFLENGFPVLPSGAEYSRAILHTTFVALSYAGFGFGEFGGRVPAAFLGVLSIPLSFFVGSRIKNMRVGLMLAFFMTFATVQIAWSRQLRFYQQLQFFFLLSLYLLERLLNKMTWKRFVPIVIAVLCMTVSHDSFGYLLSIPIIVWFLVEKSSWLWDKITSPREIKTRNWIGLALIISIFSLVLVAKGIPRGSIHNLLKWDVDYVSQYVSHFEAEIGGLFFLAIPGALLGLLERKRNLLYVFSFLLSFYVVSTRLLAFQHRYVFMLFPLLFVFAALTFDYVYERVRETLSGLRKKRSLLKRLVPALVVILVLIPMLSAAKFTFTPKSHYNLGPTAPQGEFRPAYDYVENNWEENDVIVSTLASVTWYYLQESDYWISFSHWGFHTLPDEDHYTGAEVIKTVSDLEKATEDSHGWVVIERMGKSRANSKVLKYIDDNLEMIDEISGWSEGVWVYRWE